MQLYLHLRLKQKRHSRFRAGIIIEKKIDFFAETRNAEKNWLLKFTH